MSNRSQFTLTLTLHNNRGGKPLAMAIDLDDELRIAPRAVEDMKAGYVGFNSTVDMMKAREGRKDLFISAARRLGALLAERMEDAEGWHDKSRIEPAREQLGGDWDVN